jgi:phospholipid/cholesterol/gamma-HCH transport system permease protein
MIKSAVFGFIITSVPAYFGYFVKGGSVEVAKASTTAVVQSSIVILAINYLLTQLLLL